MNRFAQVPLTYTVEASASEKGVVYILKIRSIYTTVLKGFTVPDS